MDHTATRVPCQCWPASWPIQAGFPVLRHTAMLEELVLGSVSKRSFCVCFFCFWGSFSFFLFKQHCIAMEHWGITDYLGAWHLEMGKRVLLLLVMCVYACVYLERCWVSPERNGYKELKVQESGLTLGLCMVCLGATTLPNIVVIRVHTFELQGMAFT